MVSLRKKKKKITSLTVSVSIEIFLNLEARKAFFPERCLIIMNRPFIRYFLPHFFVEYHSEAFYCPGGNKTRLLPETVPNKGLESVYSNWLKML